MTQDQEVVIVGSDGREHVFPAGFDPKRAASIVKQRTLPAPGRQQGLATIGDQVKEKGAYKAYGPMALWMRDQAEGGVNLAESADALPAVGGAIGGTIGSIGGSAFGLGVGGFPGAVAGATVGGAAGESARQLVNRATGRTAPATATSAATSIGKEAGMQGAMQAIGGAVTGAMAKTAPWLMSKAIKPSAKLLNDYRTTALDISNTLLDDGINVSQSGLEKLQKLIFADNAEIQALVSASPARIDKGKVIARVGDYADDAMRSQVNPGKSVRQATKVADEFIDHPIYKGDTVSPAEAQKLKVGTYQEIGDAFNKPQKSRALKAVARGLKEEIADAVPGVASINAREARRLAGGEAVASAIQKEASSDPLGLLFAAENPTLFIAGLLNKHPAMKSMLARGMYGSAAKLAGVPENAIRSAVLAVSSGQEDEK